MLMVKVAARLGLCFYTITIMIAHHGRNFSYRMDADAVVAFPLLRLLRFGYKRCRLLTYLLTYYMFEHPCARCGESWWAETGITVFQRYIWNFRAVDGRRFIAITRPLRYVKHRTNSKRVLITLAGAWLASGIISSPIAFGMNYTETRRHTPHICTFYNSYFLIFSSMGSFYIPCVAMLALYWQMFRTIRQRARQ